jgi:hypothetical protein
LEDLEILSSRSLGAVRLLDGLWRRLGIADALRSAVGGRRFSTDVERVLFALVANRAIDPCSKLAAAEWASQDVAIPGLAGMDEDQAYRAMDALVDADVEGEAQRRCSSPPPTCSTLRSTCSCSTPRARIPSAMPRSPTAGCAATAIPRILVPTCPRSSSAWP